MAMDSVRPPLSHLIDRAACALADNIAADRMPDRAAIRAQRATLADLLRPLADFARTMELAANTPHGSRRLSREAMAAHALYAALQSGNAAVASGGGVVDLTQRRAARPLGGGTTA